MEETGKRTGWTSNNRDYPEALKKKMREQRLEGASYDTLSTPVTTDELWKLSRKIRCISSKTETAYLVQPRSNI